MTESDAIKQANAQITDKPITWQIANTIRFLAADGVQRANSGHPGMPMGCAEIATVLFADILKYNPSDPNWINRDRFILSAGHGSMLLYSALHLSGYDVSMEDLKNFRQWGSSTPGHPEFGHAPGVETTTGPLGQGFTNAVGQALAAKWMASHFNTADFPNLINPMIYTITGDGCLMEGVSAEAASFAGHYKLDNLICIYDDNHISIDGATDLAFSREDVGARFEAYGWTVLRCNGQNFDEVGKTIRIAQDSPGTPTLIMARTTIGFGSPNKADTSGVHGSPLGADELKLAKENLGWPTEPDFFVPESVKAQFKEIRSDLVNEYEEWNEEMQKYKKAEPDKAALLDKFLSNEIDIDWDEIVLKLAEVAKAATRKSSGEVLAEIYDKMENLIGGSADLTPSNNTLVKGMEILDETNFGGRYIHYGVREHAMGGIMNGICQFGGLRAYGGTFLVFADYMRPAIRLAALMGQPVIYVFTHDSVFLGEDGPTHQPVEHLASLRAIPNLCVIRPSDAPTTAIAWKTALECGGCPTALCLTRQGVPTFPWSELDAEPTDAERGAYILAGRDVESPQVILVASGSETHLAFETWKQLKEEGISSRVIDVPSWELFDAQSDDYKANIFPAELPPTLLIEAAESQGWERYIGRNATKITIENRFGASAPAGIIAEKLGFTVENVTATAKKIAKGK